MLKKKKMESSSRNERKNKKFVYVLQRPGIALEGVNEKKSKVVKMNKLKTKI